MAKDIFHTALFLFSDNVLLSVNPHPASSHQVISWYGHVTQPTQWKGWAGPSARLSLNRRLQLGVVATTALCTQEAVNTHTSLRRRDSQF